jgi:hypothetical protein
VPAQSCHKSPCLANGGLPNPCELWAANSSESETRVSHQRDSCGVVWYETRPEFARRHLWITLSTGTNRLRTVSNTSPHCY